MALLLVELGIEYIADPDSGRPVPFAQIFVGLADTDPEIISNQRQLVVRQEDGTEVPVAQPLLTGAGGVPVYLGSPVTMLTDGNYAVKVLDKNGAQVYYVPSNTVITIDQVFDTVADMVAAVDLQPGSTARTSGYYAFADGGDALYYIQASGTPADNLIDHLLANGSVAVIRDSLVISVEQAGAIHDGVTDDLPSFNAVKTKLDLTGGGTIALNNMSPGYAVSDTIVLDSDNILIKGHGSGYHHDAGSARKMTIITRIGASTDPVISITSVINATGAKSSGSGVEGVRLDGNLIANRSLQIKSHNKYRIVDVFCLNALFANAEFTVLPIGSLGEAQDNQFGFTDGLYTNSGYPAQTNGSELASGIVFEGTSAANTSLNHFKNLSIFFNQSIGFLIGNSDNNLIENVRTFRFMPFDGENTAVVFLGGATALEAARSNTITSITAQEIFAQGTVGAVQPSINNIINSMDRENFGTVPIVETGASLIWKSELLPSGINIIQHTGGYYEVWGLQAAIPLGSTVVVPLPFSFDSTVDMHVHTTIRSLFVASSLSSPGAIASAVNAITIANSDQSVALDIEWRVIGRKTV